MLAPAVLVGYREEMPGDGSSPTIADHFLDKAPAVRDTYNAILDSARTFGPFEEQPKKTSIHLARNSSFAGVATRKSGLVLTIKSAVQVSHPRIHKIERISAHRWHFEVRLSRPEEVDEQVLKWLRAAYELSL